METKVALSTADLEAASGVAGYAKAWAGAAVGLAGSVISALLMVIPQDGDFGDLTVPQWLGVALAVLTGPAVGGIVGAVANGLKPTKIVVDGTSETAHQDPPPQTFNALVGAPPSAQESKGQVLSFPSPDRPAEAVEGSSQVIPPAQWSEIADDAPADAEEPKVESVEVDEPGRHAADEDN